MTDLHWTVLRHLAHLMDREIEPLYASWDYQAYFVSHESGYNFRLAWVFDGLHVELHTARLPDVVAADLSEPGSVDLLEAYCLEGVRRWLAMFRSP